jgi:hypothetical protein
MKEKEIALASTIAIVMIVRAINIERNKELIFKKNQRRLGLK